MRKLMFLGRTVVLVLCTALQLNAQNTREKQERPQEQSSAKVMRCATMEHLEAYFKANPGARQQATRNASRSGGNFRMGETNRTNAITTVPVVVHIVLPNPQVITDADINSFLNNLNTDYAGLNADSGNITTAFQPLRGHSEIRFALAKRTPAGQATTGIERRVSGTAFNGDVADPIKRTASGGLDSWDNLSYLNIWVGIDRAIPGFIVFGYATFPGTASAADDGLVINYNSFVSNACYTYPAVSKGRTTAHELGHYFGLYHNWGDDNGACTGDDFRQLPGSCLLPTGLFNPAGQGNTVADAGDTPNQGDATDFPALTSTTCSQSGIVTDACAAAAPGKMYQNYMDYSADNCLTLFTNKQVARMQWVIDNCRAGLKNSLALTSPAGLPATDAGINRIVSPGGVDFNAANCTSIIYTLPNCPEPFVPRLSVTNFGTTPITTLSVSINVNGTTTTTSFNVNLASNASTTLAFPTQNLITGTNTIAFTIVTVNGAADTYTANNTVSTTATIGVPAGIPVVEGFESNSFPPAGWRIVGALGTYTWERANPGRNSTWSAKIDNYNNDNVGQAVSLQTPLLRTTGIDSMVITFDVAYRPYPGYADALQVQLSADCGSTFNTYYNKAGTTLATGASVRSEFLNPTQQDWRTERVVIPAAALASGSVLLRFTNINDFGNNIFIDNINITGVYRRDAQLLAINQPLSVTCSTANTPNVTVRNVGSDTIKAFKVGYVLDNGTPVVSNFPAVNVLPGTNLSVSLTALSAPVGNHVLKTYVFDVVTNAGTGDQNTSNDTLSKAFTVVSTVAAPLAEGFDNATFPPAGWALINADGATTWQRTTAASRSGTASVYVNNYNYPANGSRDELYSPQVTYTGVDSLFLSFDVAAATYSYPGSTAIPLDTLEVLATADCGASFTTVYKKWGNTLQTIGDPNSPQTTEFVPIGSNQWRNERVNLSAFATRPGVQVVFRNTGNYENNIYIDNVNLSTKTLPAKLKEQGYLVYPSPFRSSFYIQHYLPPTELRGIAVYNAVGQQVWAREYNAAGASSLLSVDLSRFASGVYTVVLRYTNRTVSQKVLKAN